MSFKEVVQNPIVEELLNAGVVVTLIPEGVTMEGFYKSGTVSLTANQFGRLFAHSRYGISKEINSLRDLVELNIEWWEYSKKRSPNWEFPAEPWLTMAEKLGIVSVTQKVTRIVEVK